MTTKLTTIVAIDVDDYSALAAADAASAVAAVARLVERCGQAAEAHSGRIFDTSGDSVLMEFANVSSAVYAASELVANPDPPIRAAVHLGEVSQLPSGDLLGHGVTVAAKLQAHARRGGVVVSDPAWRALRGPLARRCKPKGSIKDDKTDEALRYYELIDETADAPQRHTRLLIAGGAALVALTVLALIVWPLLRADPQPRAAILPLAASNEGALQGLANGIAEDITRAVEAQHFNPVARPSTPSGGREEQLSSARQAGAPLALDGSVERVGSTLRIVMNLTRTADGAQLWSQTFEGAMDDAAALRHSAALASADVLVCGLKATRDRRDAPGDATLALLLGACSGARDPERLFDNRETLSQVAAQAPDLAIGHAMLALAHARAREAASSSMREQLRAEARAAAERALRRDRRVGEAYLALDMTERPRGWDARERILQRGLEQDEFNADLNARYSAFLFDVGRSHEALARARNASTLDPLSLEKRYAMGAALLHSGDTDAARDLVDEEMRSEHSDLRLWPLRFRLAFWRSAAGDASALLDAPDSQVRSTRGRQCWREAIAAVRSTPSAPARDGALQRVLSCSRDGDLPAGQTMMLLAQLGALDEAFALARTHFVDEQRGGEDVLFSAVARRMRTDPRFMPLMKDLGLLGYWRLSSHWPDFCREPNLPYSCEAEAQRLL